MFMKNQIQQQRSKNKRPKPAPAQMNHIVNQHRQKSAGRSSAASHRLEKINGTPNDYDLLDQVFLNDEKIARQYYRTSISKMNGVYAPNKELKKWCERNLAQFNHHGSKR